MEKSTFSPLYEHFRARLVELREKAGLSQRALAEKLKREHSFVGRIELGERRLDIVEVYWVLRALDADPQRILVELVRDFERIETQRKPASGKRAQTSRRRPL